MKIKLTPVLRLSDDGLQWTVEKFTSEHESKKVSGKIIPEQWKCLGKFWPHPDQALRYVMETFIADSKEELTIKEFEEFLIKFHKDTMQSIRDAVC